MKKLLIILLSALSLTALAQQKTVAVLDPICRDNSVNPFYQQMVRGAMESAVTASSEYEAYDRSAFDQIQKEQEFQRTGAVNDSQIKKMGEMAGVDYVLVSEVTAYEGYMSAIVKILNVTTGKYDKSTDDYMELKPEAVKGKCKEMAASLFGKTSSYGSSFNNSNTDKEFNQTQVIPAQTIEEDEEVAFVTVEEMPEFPGGQQALFKFLSENVKYPAEAYANGIQGRVICQFVVNKDGSIADVKVVRSGGDPSLDKEAVRVIQLMPKWKPGKQRGKYVRVKYTVPINFKIPTTDGAKMQKTA